MAQRTKINLGSVSAEVSLAPMSSDPAAAKWETRRMVGEAIAPETPAPEVMLSVTDDSGPVLLEPDAPEPDPLGAMDPPNLRVGGAPIIPQDVDQAQARDAMLLNTTEARIARGVVNDEGDFVELTDELKAIDEAVKIDGLEVVAAIPVNTIPRERVRGSFYVVPVDALATKALKLILEALHGDKRALAVRWTKRTNQALGIIVPAPKHDGLVLLEVAFADTVKAIPARAKLGAVKVTDAEMAAAGSYVESLAAPTSAINEIADERRRLHADLIAKAKAGEPFEVVKPEPDVDAEFAVLLAATA